MDPVIPNFDMSSFHAAFGVIPPETPPPGRAPHAPHSHRNGTTNGDVIPEGSDDGAELGYRATPLGQLDKPTGVLRVWFLVLEGLTNTVSACTRNYQPQILQTLFDLLRSAAEVPGQCQLFEYFKIDVYVMYFYYCICYPQQSLLS